ncbi:MAG: hypothetical protein AAF662_05275 [Pseudomonadota bacterium]
MTNKKIKLGDRVEDELPVPAYSWETPREKSARDRKNRNLAKKGDPVELSLDHILSGHVLLRGRTGQGKSQLILVLLLIALMPPYEVEWEELDG